MIEIYSDGAFDDVTKMGTFCLVLVAGGKKDWQVAECDDTRSSNDVELAGLQSAINIAVAAVEAGKCKETDVHLYCDNMWALKKAQRRTTFKGFKFHFIKGHLLSSTKYATPVTEDTKRQHWADCMATGFLRRRLTQNNSSV